MAIPTLDVIPPGAARPGEDVQRTRAFPTFLHPRVTRSGQLGFGAKRGRFGHWGVDMPVVSVADGGTGVGEVSAPEGMVIRHVWTNDSTPPFVGYGPAGVVGEGDSGVYHLLAHLDPSAWSASSIPTKGQRYDVGELVGLMSESVKPPHLHWEVRVFPVDDPKKRAATSLDPWEWRFGKRRILGGAGASWWLWVILGLALARRR